MSLPNPLALRRHDRARYAHSFPALQRGLLVILLFAGAGAKAATLVDSVERRVEVPAKPVAIVPAGAPAQILLQALVPDRLAGLVEPFAPEHAIYVDAAITRLPQIPVLTRTKAPGDLAMIRDLKPDLVVDYGNASARYAAADESIQKTLSVPTLLYEGSLVGAPDILRKLGGAIGAARAETVAGTIEGVLARAKNLSALGDADRVTVYLARGADGLTAARSQTSFDEPIRLAGGRNVVSAGAGTFKHMSVDEVVALAPTVVIFADRDALSGPLRAALPKSTRFLIDNGEPYKVLAGPPSVNRITGVAALAAVLHPDLFKMDSDEITRLETSLFPIPPGLALPAPLALAP